jgi:hypothetical protein
VKEVEMRKAAVSIMLSLTSVFLLAAGCGETEDDPGPSTTTGGTAGTGAQAGGSGGAPGGSGASTGSGGSLPMGPTGCEDETPESGEPCSDRHLVCPSLLGSCVCRGENGDLEWTCYEVGGEPDGSGGGGPDQGGQGGQAPIGGGGNGGDPLGGQGGGGGDGEEPPVGGAGAGGQGGSG